jgi:hypothetical protein
MVSPSEEASKSEPGDIDLIETGPLSSDETIDEPVTSGSDAIVTDQITSGSDEITDEERKRRRKRK